MTSTTNTYVDSLAALMDKVDSLGWGYEIDSENKCIELEQWSPAGEDFVFYVYGDTVDEIIQAIRDYADDFDIEEHVKMWLDAKEAKVSGVPDVCTLVEDAKAIQEMLNELAWDSKIQEIYEKD